MAGAIPPITLGLRIRAAREYAGMDQAELAERAGIARGTISAAERGHRTPQRASLTLIAFATGVDPDWLRTGEETPRPDGPGGAQGLPRLDLNQQPFD